MPRGHRRDNAITDLLYANQLLLDDGSFVSLSNPPHLYLKGDDVKVQRHRVWIRSGGVCRQCGYMAQCEEGWEMDHIISKGKGGSDDLQNLQTLCPDCHHRKHMQIRFGERKAEAVKDFDEVMGRTGEKTK